jgi:hypothetical protein
MPSTYTLISSNVLGSSAASVTFSAIPATYTDLVLRISARNTTTSEDIDLTINGDTSTLYSRTYLLGNGTGTGSFRNSGQPRISLDNSVVPSSYTASTFSNLEIYIPSYTATQNRPISSISVTENNATLARIVATAGLYLSTTAITQVQLATTSGNFDTGSSFYLYGIKNS